MRWRWGIWRGDEGYGGEIDVEMISRKGKVVRIGVLLKDSEVILEVRWCWIWQFLKALIILGETGGGEIIKENWVVEGRFEVEIVVVNKDENLKWSPICSLINIKCKCFMFLLWWIIEIYFIIEIKWSNQTFFHQHVCTWWKKMSTCIWVKKILYSCRN